MTSKHRAVAIRTAAVVLATYLVVALATVAFSGHRILPLFEGVGPPSPYRWVKPPPEFAATNVKPKAATTDFPLTGPAVPLFAITPDGQCQFSLPYNSFPRHGADTTVRAVITPIDPATLSRLPSSSVAANGNAYRIQLTYLPSGTPLTKVSTPGDVVLTTPHRPDSIFYSANARSWSEIQSQAFGGTTMIGAPFSMAGWFLAGANPSVIPGAPSSNARRGTGLVAVGVVIAAVLLGILALTVAVRRRRGGSFPA